MTRNGYNLLAALAVAGAVIVALLGDSHPDDLLAAMLAGGAFTIAGRGEKA